MKRVIALAMLGIFALVTFTGCHASGDVDTDHDAGASGSVSVH